MRWKGGKRMALTDANECGECRYRAWTWQGGSEPTDLRLEWIDMPELATGEVLVRNAAIGLNPVDWKLLPAGAQSGWNAGHVPGVDGAGMVIALGDDVDDGWLGARVAYHTSLQNTLGSFAEYTPVPARALMRVPDALDLDVAASFPCPGLTAWQAIEKLPHRDGTPLLISGAGGAVGQYLVQYAARRGYAVTALCNPRHWDRLRRLGAAQCIQEPVAGQFFAVIDAVGPDHAARLVPLIGANGHIVCIQGRLEEWPVPAFGRALSMHEVALGALHIHGSDQDWAQLTAAGESLLADIGKASIHPEPLVTLGFTDLPSHLNALKHRNFSGKALIQLN